MLIDYVRKISLRKNFRWVALIFLLAMFLIENPWFGQRHLEEITGGLRMIDMNLFNTPAEIFNYLRTIGESGRKAYLLLLGLDSFLIVSLFSFSGALTYRSIDDMDLSESHAWLLYVPFAKALCDMIENLAMLWTTHVFPNNPLPVTYLASIATVLKWVFMGAMLALILTLMGFKLYKKIIHTQEVRSTI